MKNISHTTPDDIVIIRFARGHSGKVYYSKTWYLTKWEDRKPTYFSLGRNLRSAEKRAREIDALVRSGTMCLAEIKLKYGKGRLRREDDKDACTIGEIVDTILAEAALLNLKPLTARSYTCSLIKVVREATSRQRGGEVTDDEVRQMKSTFLTSSTFNEFKRGRAERAEELENKRARASACRSANKDIAQAKAALAPGLQKLLSERELRFPDFESWRSVTKFTGVEFKYRLPPAENIRRVMEAIRGLEPGSNLWKVSMLATYLGMRSGEIAYARWSWFVPGATPTVAVQQEDDFSPKRDHERDIEPPGWAFEALMRHKGNGEVYVLSGDEAARLRAVNDHGIQFLRASGVKAQKPMHELRKWFGSWVATTRGLTVAQRLLGHDSYSTTEDHYSDINFPAELRPLWECAA